MGPLRIINAGDPITRETDLLFESMVSERQGNSSQTHLGLGLYIARVITDFHGGEISLSNREDTAGAVVTVTLPVLRLTTKLA